MDARISILFANIRPLNGVIAVGLDPGRLIGNDAVWFKEVKVAFHVNFNKNLETPWTESVATEVELLQHEATSERFQEFLPDLPLLNSMHLQVVIREIELPKISLTKRDNPGKLMKRTRR